MRRVGICAVCLACGTLAAQASLTLNIYGNTALSGSPTSSRTIEALNFSNSGASPFSAEILGTMTVAEGEYGFECDFGHATIAFLLVDDHLVCQTGAYSVAPAVTGVDNPLRKLTKAGLPVRLEVYYSARGYSGAAVDVRVTVVTKSQAPVFSPTLSSVETQRRDLQHSLLKGWGTWNHDTLCDQALIPSGIAITAALCSVSDGGVVSGCTTDARPDRFARAGLLAIDRSYGQFYNNNGTLNVSYTFAGGGDDLRMTFTRQPGAVGSFAVVVFGKTLWGRAADVTAATGSLSFAPFGMEPISIYAATDSGLGETGARWRLGFADDRPHFILPLVEGSPVGLSSGKPQSVSSIAALLDENREKELKSYEKYGDFAQVKAAAQAGVMWNVVYVPTEAGPVAPVSRGWDFTKGAVSPEWGYVLFDWDNIFASYILSLDAKDLAYSNFIQVIRSKTAEGFVPNFAAALQKSLDRTEPPIGSKVLLEIFEKYQDKWIVELLFDDLLDWSNWFLAKRQLPPLNLISLGGEDMQGARFESGLDNSPMYDGEFYNATTQQMQLYDVGMTSMFTMEAEALAKLADAIKRPEGDMLRLRAAAMRQKLSEELWDQESGAFVNKFPNNTFYRRVSPTSFYPLLTGGPTAEQADTMMTRWLMNRTRFCITPNGDFAGNTDTCYWGLPSISADDAAFPPLGYWRGYVWGPMMQLTYWGLQRYDSVPSVRTARKALCKQMKALFLSQWTRNGHICENFGPHKDTQDCTGNRFYHWGALAGFIGLIENGYYGSAFGQPELVV